MIATNKKNAKIRLAELRHERELTQKELANIIGIDPSTIANYEVGSRSPDYFTLVKIADYFGVSTDYILGRTDNPHTDTIKLAVKSLPPRIQNILLHDAESALPFLEFAADCLESNISLETLKDLFKNIFTIIDKLKEIK